MEFDEKTIEKNANLTTKFTECFRNKNSFNTLGNESITDIRMMVYLIFSRFFIYLIFFFGKIKKV